MSLSIMNDNELVRDYIQGNKRSFEELVLRHQQKVFNYILSYVKDKALADDLLQDTFIKIVNTLKNGTYRDEGKFIQWVMRIAHNIVIDHFRKDNRFPTLKSGNDFNIFDMIGNFDDSVEQKLIKKQIHEDIRKLIKQLPEDQRRVLIMRHYGEMSFKEIAEKTGVSINTALGRMRYALINMRKLVEEKEMILN
ncbi:MAG: RNA polymerase sigma factor [Bacteroidales bacterium]|nr:sigma-70 family RNA polymerase sigma factor [Bacteroidales bacterium]MDD4544989.1 sigma-70 family RNA polymerase sigma factor [Bacteroidales bacterium]MDY0053922.1 sigma-70 family RNA polymerase sigma factor [Bacteroidales bacterium]